MILFGLLSFAIRELPEKVAPESSVTLSVLNPFDMLPKFSARDLALTTIGQGF